MSTSDPKHPSTDGSHTPAASPTPTDRPADAPTDVSGTAPDPVTRPSRPASTTPTPTTAEPPADTGRHAVVRPAPTPPPDASAAGTAPTGTNAGTNAGTDAGTRTAAAASADPARPATPAVPAPDPDGPPPAVADGSTPPPAAPRVERGDDDLFPAPNAPRSTSFGAHVLGVVLGLLLAPAGVAMVLVGQARILAAQVDGWDGSTEVLGIVLVTIGLLVLGLVALLAVWSAAVPIAGGALLTVVGGFYLFAPSIARAQTLDVLSDTGWRLTVTQVTVAGTSGTLLVAGFLVLLAGVSVALARRRGVHLGEFRERHRA